jgi:NAD(P)H-hydrate epimerase
MAGSNACPTKEIGMASSNTLSRDEVRELDRWAAEEGGLPTRVLMENAGRGSADVLMSLGVHGRVVVCCGKGNNGGDGLVLARHLAVRDVDVEVLLFVPPESLTGDAAANWTALEAAKVPATVAVPFEEAATKARLERAEWIVDALFGIGLTGPARPPFDRLIALMNEAPAKILAIDIPSGVDADTGEPLGPTIRAAHTVTFVAAKKGFANPSAAAWTGEVHVVDIGVRRP